VKSSETEMCETLCEPFSNHLFSRIIILEHYFDSESV